MDATRREPEIARYTRQVTVLPRTVSLALVLVLAVLPVSAAVCATVCLSGAEASPADGHHASAPSCHEPPAHSGPVVRNVTTGDCGRHDGSGHEAAPSRTALRAGSGAPVMVAHIHPAVPESSLAGWRVARLSEIPPPGRSSPARAPLVLRI
jgi:hypothetical protein